MQLKNELQKQRQAGLWRQHRRVQSPPQPEIRIEGRTVLSFASNDYLGLANDERIKRAFQQGIERWGSGAASAHLISGHTEAHAELEQALAHWLGREKALLFSSGYLANLAVITALVGRGDSLIADKLNHASLIDAARLSQAKHWRFAHNDLAAAEQRLQQAKGNKLLVVESVFSMDGDEAPLAELAELAQQYGAWLMVDEAHGLGVLGEQGRGGSAALSMEQVPIIMGTFGKALGTAGAFIAGPADLIDYLIQKARPYIFTTAQPAALAEATLCSLRIVQQAEDRRQHLRHLIAQLRQALGDQLLPSRTPIQPLLLGETQIANEWAQKLWQQGIWLPAIRPPTVPQGQARFRISLSAAHTEKQLQRLIQALQQA